MDDHVNGEAVDVVLTADPSVGESACATEDFEEVERDHRWERHDAVIPGPSGAPVFRQDGCLFPASWSDMARNVVASKYFYGDLAAGNGDPSMGKREYSLVQLVRRVVSAITDAGVAAGYFPGPDDASEFRKGLARLCYEQRAAFNSPVWFNVGLSSYRLEGDPGNYRWSDAIGSIARADDVVKYPQASACFIQSVSDDMESIMGLAASEAMLFKFGSGTGTDLSTLRSSREKLTGGGRPSGPVSFMKVYDAVASVVKSGGKTRRAAKIQTMKCHHPDIMEFIRCKSLEERKARALIRAGYEADFNGEAYGSVMFQNSNLSVRCTDDFLGSVVGDAPWATRSVTTGEVVESLRARDVMDAMAESAWLCGDPGIQYEDTVQRWHTCPETAPINSSNPCGEYLFIDDSACNLASINLLKYLMDDGTFDVDGFRDAVRLLITAQDILVDHASYPTAKIAENSHRFRPLGLGYANLGALLMAMGLPYDSDDGRQVAAAITGVMHGTALSVSSRLAALLGPFDGHARNREAMEKVVSLHVENALACFGKKKKEAPPRPTSNWRKEIERLEKAALAAVCSAGIDGRKWGFRNSQVTLLAPTGTIAFMMDCDTTGVEPDIALVKYKNLAGRGALKIVNKTVARGLQSLGYPSSEAAAIRGYIEEHDKIEGAPCLDDDHLCVFDCAFEPPGGGRSIGLDGHLLMMAAVQPFLSGAISKTCNLPATATVDDVREAYMKGWGLGLKSLTIYRDGSKGSQPVTTTKDAPRSEEGAAPAAVSGPVRRRLPATRRAVTHKFNVQGHEGYVSVGFYEDGAPGELFITMAKEGSIVGGLMDVLGTAISIGLQYGVPLEVLVRKFTHTRFEPSGFTDNPDIPMASSVADYIFRWMGRTFLDGGAASPGVDGDTAEIAAPTPSRNGVASREDQFQRFQTDAPPCDVCGALTVRSGSCYRCANCGTSLGCS